MRSCLTTYAIHDADSNDLTRRISTYHRKNTMHPRYPCSSLDESSGPRPPSMSVASSSSSSVSHHKLIDYLRAETTRLIMLQTQLQQTNVSSASSADNAQTRVVYSGEDPASKAGDCFHAEHVNRGHGNDGGGIASILTAARFNIHNSIVQRLQRRSTDPYEVEKADELLQQLPCAHVSLDEDFRRWTEQVACEPRVDVEMMSH